MTPTERQDLSDKVARLETLLIEAKGDIKDLREDLKASNSTREIATLQAFMEGVRAEQQSLKELLHKAELKLERVDTRSAIIGAFASAVIAGLVTLMRLMGS
jgi:chromosome segregation ATPase